MRPLQAHTISVEAKSKESVEKKMAERFNAWAAEHPGVEIYHIFEPERWAKRYGDYTYNTDHVSFTFFYFEPEEPAKRETRLVRGKP